MAGANPKSTLSISPSVLSVNDRSHFAVQDVGYNICCRQIIQIDRTNILQIADAFTALFVYTKVGQEPRFAPARMEASMSIHPV
jgi:hypothetical protein